MRALLRRTCARHGSNDSPGLTPNCTSRHDKFLEAMRPLKASKEATGRLLINGMYCNHFRICFQKLEEKWVLRAVSLWHEASGYRAFTAPAGEGCVLPRAASCADIPPSCRRVLRYCGSDAYHYPLVVDCGQSHSVCGHGDCGLAIGWSCARAASPLALS